MKGRPLPSKRQVRESENQVAVGGMRNPDLPVPRILNAKAAGSQLATLLLECIGLNPRVLDPVTAILSGSTSAGFLPDDVQTIREFIAAQTQSGAPRPDPGLDPSAFRMWTRLSGDPDTDLAQWLDTGAPLGIIHPVTSKGIFPPVDSIVPTSESIAPPFP